MAIREIRGMDLWKEIKKEGFPSDMSILAVKNKRLTCKKLGIRFFDNGQTWEEGNVVFTDEFFDFGRYRHVVKYKKFPSGKTFTMWDTLIAYAFRMT